MYVNLFSWPLSSLKLTFFLGGLGLQFEDFELSLNCAVAHVPEIKLYDRTSLIKATLVVPEMGSWWFLDRIQVEICGSWPPRFEPMNRSRPQLFFLGLKGHEFNMAPNAMEACREALLGGLEKILEKHHKRLVSRRSKGFFPRKIVYKWFMESTFMSSLTQMGSWWIDAPVHEKAKFTDQLAKYLAHQMITMKS